MFFNWALFAALAMILFHLQIVLVEEKYLAAVFGEEYETYRKRVNRYIGRKAV
ncbi:MAG TPA: hypothetical protein PLD49_08745 [Thermoclostridium caenicola]|uniref:methyltransferase family protein n=1 Tax=Thermoclostridium caenicola TaxID=659425 RepID=UPI00165F365D|nr:hypothetical protein [Thermoclostridium caenicola]HOK43738.1 hypothetical protein [Thermoclostridium caenicola]HOL84724.1 hypothetical protein [Thermoclostridium caenicola]HOP72353.1 hypothetical protein [Thermoclostridium caenicola]HPO75875.1 hypothetical protein [Thermoclostridium caenicola]